MTNSIGVNSGGPLHESQATLYGIVGNAAVKLPDVAADRTQIPRVACRTVVRFVALIESDQS